jgi:hypothetical protein
MRRLRHLPAAVVAALALAALTLAASASAETVRLGWVEKLDKGPAVRLTFRVGTLETSGKAWSATVEIVNRSTGRVTVARSQFAIVEFATATDFKRPLRFLPAATFRPPLPAVLAPGKSWKGTVGGAGTPDDRQYVRLVLGPFATAAAPTPFTWITDHAQHRFTIVI